MIMLIKSENIVYINVHDLHSIDAEMEILKFQPERCCTLSSSFLMIVINNIHFTKGNYFSRLLLHVQLWITESNAKES